MNTACLILVLAVVISKGTAEARAFSEGHDEYGLVNDMSAAPGLVERHDNANPIEKKLEESLVILHELEEQLAQMTEKLKEKRRFICTPVVSEYCVYP